MEAIATAALYSVLRQQPIARTMSEICAAANIPRDELGRYLKYTLFFSILILLFFAHSFVLECLCSLVKQLVKLAPALPLEQDAGITLHIVRLSLLPITR
jgi:hypothetical protein